MSRSTRLGRSDRRPSSAKAREWLLCEKSGLAGRIPCQRISGGNPPPPVKKVRRRSTGCAFRKAINILTNRRKPAFRSRWDQSIQLRALSWHHALLLPCWVRRNSSPPRIIGTPCDTMRVVSRLRACRLLIAFTVGSFVEPSAPQFQLQLASLPSRFPSPLASLCLLLYETRS